MQCGLDMTQVDALPSRGVACVMLASARRFGVHSGKGLLQVAHHTSVIGTLHWAVLTPLQLKRNGHHGLHRVAGDFMMCALKHPMGSPVVRQATPARLPLHGSQLSQPTVLLDVKARYEGGEGNLRFACHIAWDSGWWFSVAGGLRRKPWQQDVSPMPVC